MEKKYIVRDEKRFTPELVFETEQEAIDCALEKTEQSINDALDILEEESGEEAKEKFEELYKVLSTLNKTRKLPRFEDDRFTHFFVYDEDYFKIWDERSE